MKPLCIWHGNCQDGFGAAWSVRHALGDGVEFHAGVYQDAPPDVTGRDVIMVDFSYKRPVLDSMIAVANSIVIIDHHKTAEADLAPFKVEMCGSARFRWADVPGMLEDYRDLRLVPIIAHFDMEHEGERNYGSAAPPRRGRRMSEPPKDPPIEPLDYVSGVKVVDIGDIRVARGMSRRPFSACRHRRLHYDKQERRVWCADCEQNIEAFDAFELIVEQFADAARKIDKRVAELKEAEQFQSRTLAARHLDLAWRSRSMVPACPTCGCGLFPEDFRNGIGASLGREYAEAQRKKRRGKT